MCLLARVTHNESKVRLRFYGRKKKVFIHTSTSCNAHIAHGSVHIMQSAVLWQQDTHTQLTSP